MKQKKIAIMTWHNYNNYGGVLQAFALQKVISNNDGVAELINYIPKNKKISIFKQINIKKAFYKLFYRKNNINHYIDERNNKAL